MCRVMLSGSIIPYHKIAKTIMKYHLISLPAIF